MSCGMTEAGHGMASSGYIGMALLHMAKARQKCLVFALGGVLDLGWFLDTGYLEGKNHDQANKI